MNVHDPDNPEATNDAMARGEAVYFVPVDPAELPQHGVWPEPWASGGEPWPVDWEDIGYTTEKQTWRERVYERLYGWRESFMDLTDPTIGRFIRWVMTR